MINTNFPKTFEHALSNVAQKAGWSLHKYENHGVQVRELRRWEGTTLRKIQANLREDQKIQIIIKSDAFNNWPKLRIWLHNNIPMFPYTAYITWKETDVLDSTLLPAEYEVVLLTLTNRSV